MTLHLKPRIRHAGTSKFCREITEEKVNIVNDIFWQATLLNQRIYDLKWKEIAEFTNDLKHQGRHSLATEVDLTLRKISDSMSEFEEVLCKYKNASTTNQRERFDGDLKRDMKKLQRLRDLLKTWLNDDSIKDKEVLELVKLVIDSQMGRFKSIERDSKGKEFADQLSIGRELTHSEQLAKYLNCWITKSVQSLQSQINCYELDMESMLDGKKKKTRRLPNELNEIKNHISSHEFHIGKLQTVQRVLNELEELDLENGTDMLAEFIPKVQMLVDDIDYYVDASGEPEYENNEFLYEGIDEFEKHLEIVQAKATAAREEQEAYNKHMCELTMESLNPCTESEAPIIAGSDSEVPIISDSGTEVPMISDSGTEVPIIPGSESQIPIIQESESEILTITTEVTKSQEIKREDVDLLNNNTTDAVSNIIENEYENLRNEEVQLVKRQKINDELRVSPRIDKTIIPPIRMGGSCSTRRTSLQVPLVQIARKCQELAERNQGEQFLHAWASPTSLAGGRKHKSTYTMISRKDRELTLEEKKYLISFPPLGNFNPIYRITKRNGLRNSNSETDVTDEKENSIGLNIDISERADGEAIIVPDNDNSLDRLRMKSNICNLVQKNRNRIHFHVYEFLSSQCREFEPDLELVESAILSNERKILRSRFYKENKDGYSNINSFPEFQRLDETFNEAKNLSFLKMERSQSTPIRRVVDGDQVFSSIAKPIMSILSYRDRQIQKLQQMGFTPGVLILSVNPGVKTCFYGFPMIGPPVQSTGAYSVRIILNCVSHIQVQPLVHDEIFSLVPMLSEHEIKQTKRSSSSESPSPVNSSRSENNGSSSQYPEHPSGVDGEISSDNMSRTVRLINLGEAPGIFHTTRVDFMVPVKPRNFYNKFQTLPNAYLLRILYRQQSLPEERSVARQILIERGWRYSFKQGTWFIRKYDTWNETRELTVAYERGAFYVYDFTTGKVNIINDFLLEFCFMEPVEDVLIRSLVEAQNADFQFCENKKYYNKIY